MFQGNCLHKKIIPLKVEAPRLQTGGLMRLPFIDPSGAKRGFSLMELIIYIGIIALVSTSLVLFSLALSNYRQKALAASEAESNAKIVLNYLNRYLRSARSIDEANSVFDNNQGRLALWLGPTSTKPVIFSLDSTVRPQIKFDEQPSINLSSQAVWFPIFKFKKISDSQIGIELEVRAGQLDIKNSPENFYQTKVKTIVNLRK